MGINKVIKTILSILLIACLIPASVLAVDSQSAGSTTVSVEVYQVTIACGGGGSYTVDGITYKGTHDFYTRSGVTLQVTPNSGYAMNKTLIADGEAKLTLDGNTILIDNISSNVTLRVTFYSTESSSGDTSDEDSESDDGNSTSTGTTTTTTTTTTDTTDTTTTLPTLSGDVADTSNLITDESTLSGSVGDIDTSTVADSTITGDNAEVDSEANAEAVTAGDGIVVESAVAIVSEDLALSFIEETPDQTVMTFQLRDLDEEVKGVEIPVNSLRELESRDGELNIVVTNFEVRFDKEATRAIVGQANGETVYINVEPIELETLEEQQVVSVEDKVVLISFSASVISGGVNISDFWEGQATIMIPFEPEENVDIDEYAVVYIPKNGEIEVMDSHYEDGCMVFSINHFSEYAIVRDATLKDAEMDATNQSDTLEGNLTQSAPTTTTQTTSTSNSWIWIVITTLIALLAIFLLILIKRRNKEQK